MKKIIFLSLFCLMTYPMEHNKQLSIISGACSIQGYKEQNEDRYVLSNVRSAVFDGHAGCAVATMAQETFFVEWNEYIRKNNDAEIIKNALCHATHECEKKTWNPPFAFNLNEEDKEPWQDKAVGCGDGSMMLASYIEDISKQNTLHIVWLGDSRGILGNNESIIFATKDHKPTDPQEKAYIEKFGGFVCDDARVCKDLAASRALGDIHLKKSLGQGPLNATPDYASIIFTGDESFYLEVSDGFTDVIQNEEVPKLVNDSRELNLQEFKIKYPVRYRSWDIGHGGSSRRTLENKINNPFSNIAKQVATRLVYIAMANRGSSDDVTVIVKLFNWNTSSC